MNEPQVFLDMDTQVDFMLPTGSLYVPGAETIIPNLKKLMDYARERSIPVVPLPTPMHRTTPRSPSGRRTVWLERLVSGALWKHNGPTRASFRTEPELSSRLPASPARPLSKSKPTT